MFTILVTAAGVSTFRSGANKTMELFQIVHGIAALGAGTAQAALGLDPNVLEPLPAQFVVAGTAPIIGNIFYREFDATATTDLVIPLEVKIDPQQTISVSLPSANTMLLFFR